MPRPPLAACSPVTEWERRCRSVAEALGDDTADNPTLSSSRTPFVSYLFSTCSSRYHRARAIRI